MSFVISAPVYPWNTTLNILQPDKTYLKFPVYYEICGYEELGLNASTNRILTKTDLNSTDAKSSVNPTGVDYTGVNSSMIGYSEQDYVIDLYRDVFSSNCPTDFCDVEYSLVDGDGSDTPINSSYISMAASH